jgi:integrase
MNNQMIRREVILPKMNHCKGDISKQWFVYFSVKDPATGRMQVFRKYDGFAELKTVEDRNKHGKKLIARWSKKLMSGWNPFFEADIVKYASRIKYDEDARKQGRVIESTRNFEYYSSMYLDYINSIKLRPSTYTTYKSKLRIFGLFLIEHGLDKTNIRFFNNDTIKEFNTYLRQKRGLEGKGINEYNEALHRFFRYLIEELKYITENPLKGTKHLKETNQPHLAFNDVYIKKLREMVEKDDKYIWLMCRMIFSCFTRPKELRLLQIKHFNWADGTIKLPAEISKNNKTRLITIPDYMLTILIENKVDTYPEDYFFMSLDRQPGPKPVHKNWLYRKMKHYFVELKFPKGYTLYSFKHTGVQKLAKADVNLLYIQGQLGHSSLDEMYPYIQELLMQSNDEIRYNSPEI